MKKRFLMLAGCLSLAMAAPALAATGPYFGVQGGASLLPDEDFQGTGAYSDTRFTDEYDAGYTVGAFVGYRLTVIRLEAELSYRQSDLDDIKDASVAGVGVVSSFEDAGIGVDGETNVTSLMFNAYFDLRNPTPFTPYVMAGVGGANVERDNLRLTSGAVTITAPDDDDTVLAWQVGAGVDFDFTEFLSLGVGYRYFATDDPEYSGMDGEFDSHNIIASIRFNF